MKGYIYKQYAGADPSTGWTFNDPIFGGHSTLGACMPNIRSFVDVGDWVFTISGRTPSVVPYVVGGFKVDEKIDALEAHVRFPEYRLRRNDRGQVIGNVIVESDGSHHTLDDHDKFDRRRQNYLVGTEAVFLSSAREIALGREKTQGILQDVFDRKANRLEDLVPRWRRLEHPQVDQLVAALRGIKRDQ